MSARELDRLFEMELGDERQRVTFGAAPDRRVPGLRCEWLPIARVAGLRYECLDHARVVCDTQSRVWHSKVEAQSG